MSRISFIEGKFKMGLALLDISGMIFGRLMVLRLISSRASNGQSRWFCLCNCGKSVVVNKNNLISGITKSCGCLRLGPRIHGQSQRRENDASSTYRSWSHMKWRCLNSNCSTFKYYGGRGIRMCERWMNFINFLEDMGERSPGLSLDRIDNGGNYEPSNCRWATRSQQMKNRREGGTY